MSWPNRRPHPRKGRPILSSRKRSFVGGFLANFATPPSTRCAARSTVSPARLGMAYHSIARARSHARLDANSPTPTMISPFDWIAARETIRAAQNRHEDPARPARILLISCSGPQRAHLPRRNVQSSRLVQIAEDDARSSDSVSTPSAPASTSSAIWTSREDLDISPGQVCSLRAEQEINRMRAGRAGSSWRFCAAADCLACGDPVDGEIIVGVGEFASSLACDRALAML